MTNNIQRAFQPMALARDWSASMIRLAFKPARNKAKYTFPRSTLLRVRIFFAKRKKPVDCRKIGGNVFCHLLTKKIDL